MSTSNDERKLLWDLIKDIRFGMFTTRHPNGHLHSRPTTTQNAKMDEDDCLWFFMSRRSDPVDDFHEEPSVNIAYADPDKDRYVSVSGTASLVDDVQKKHQLWSKPAQAWFPEGADSSDLALVRVRISHANYWDVKDSKMVQLFKMMKAAATGQPPTNLGKTGEVRMH
jgi:general stress protein 26